MAIDHNVSEETIGPKRSGCHRDVACPCSMTAALEFTKLGLAVTTADEPSASITPAASAMVFRFIELVPSFNRCNYRYRIESSMVLHIVANQVFCNLNA